MVRPVRPVHYVRPVHPFIVRLSVCAILRAYVRLVSVTQAPCVVVPQPADSRLSETTLELRLANVRVVKPCICLFGMLFMSSVILLFVNLVHEIIRE